VFWMGPFFETAEVLLFKQINMSGNEIHSNFKFGSKLSYFIWHEYLKQWGMFRNFICDFLNWFFLSLCTKHSTYTLQLWGTRAINLTQWKTQLDWAATSLHNSKTGERQLTNHVFSSNFTGTWYKRLKQWH
jgi:hypothetical protein